MDRLDLNLWNQALAQIQSQLPSQAYETWFQPTRAVDSTHETLVIEVPNLFFRDWLKSHYTNLIDQALEKVASTKVRVEYTLAAPLNRSETAPTSLSQTSKELSSQKSADSFSGRFGSGNSVLNRRYTFDQFVIGPSNRFAHAAALAVSESPAKVYNPLFIYGGVGLGKTHLMQAIGYRVRERFPAARCIYISSEQFTNQLIWAIQNRSMESFRERFRSADVLLVDDIHFISSKEATQEGFFHTFNVLYDAHKQIVISSDRPPKELHGVEERLVSRFEWGLVVDIQPPDLETRIAILNKKAQTQGTQVPSDVILFIAERVTSNIRELEGALNRVIAYSVLVGRPIALDMAQEVLKGFVAESVRNVTIEKIQRFVADYFRISIEDLKGKRRDRGISFPRQLAMWMAREFTEASLIAIGEAFGGRDHATVLYACQKIEEAKERQGKVNEVIENLCHSFQNMV